MKTTKLIGEVSQEQIDKWKADPKVEKVHSISVEGHICYVRKVDRATASYALSHTSFKMSTDDNTSNGIEMNMGDMYKKGEAVLTNCWLGGSEEIKTNTDLWISACITAGNLVEVKTTELKNC